MVIILVDEMVKFAMGDSNNLSSFVEMDTSSIVFKSMIYEILDWMKLEYKRTEWMKQGKKDMRKPLTLSNYPWCDLLIATCESCKAFKDIFIVNDRKFMFSSDVIEENR